MHSNTDGNSDITADEAAYHRWLPVEALQPGMILAKPVHVAHHSLLTMKLSEGVELKSNTIDQLLSHGVECVAVKENSGLDETQLSALKKAYFERLLEIFACASEADVPRNNRGLFAALLKAGPQI